MGNNPIDSHFSKKGWRDLKKYFQVNDERKICRTVRDRPPGKRCLGCSSLTGEKLQEFIR